METENNKQSIPSAFGLSGDPQQASLLDSIEPDEPVEFDLPSETDLPLGGGFPDAVDVLSGDNISPTTQWTSQFEVVEAPDVAAETGFPDAADMIIVPLESQVDDRTLVTDRPIDEASPWDDAVNDAALPDEQETPVEPAEDYSLVSDREPRESRAPRGDGSFASKRARTTDRGTGLSRNRFGGSELSAGTGTASTHTSSRRRNRQEPKKNINITTIGIAIVAVILLIGISWYAVTVFAKSTPAYKIEKLHASIAETDKDIARIDALLNTEISLVTSEDITGSRALVEPTLAALDKAEAELDKLVKKANDEVAADIEAFKAELAQRRKLVKLAPKLIDSLQQAQQALITAMNGWDQLQVATKEAKAAGKLLDTKKKSKMKEVITKNKHVLTKLAEARVEFNDVSKSLPQAKFGSYLTYIGAREQMAQSAINAAQDLLANDKTAFKIDITRYNQNASTARAQEKKLKKPRKIVTAGYKKLAGKSYKSYFKIRDGVIVVQ